MHKPLYPQHRDMRPRDFERDHPVIFGIVAVVLLTLGFFTIVFGGVVLEAVLG